MAEKWCRICVVTDLLNSLSVNGEAVEDKLNLCIFETPFLEKPAPPETFRPLPENTANKSKVLKKSKVAVFYRALHWPVQPLDGITMQNHLMHLSDKLLLRKRANTLGWLPERRIDGRQRQAQKA
jgi:hypothetical protein